MDGCFLSVLEAEMPVRQESCSLVGTRRRRYGQRLTGSPTCASMCSPRRRPTIPPRPLATLLREELFAKPRPWLRWRRRDLRLNSHDQVEDDWRVDVSDRGVRRPRRVAGAGHRDNRLPKLTLDVGKQFIRWGKGRHPQSNTASHRATTSTSSIPSSCR